MNLLSNVGIVKYGTRAFKLRVRCIPAMLILIRCFFNTKKYILNWTVIYFKIKIEEHNETLFFRACFWPFLNSLNYKTRLLAAVNFCHWRFTFLFYPGLYKSFFNCFSCQEPTVPLVLLQRKSLWKIWMKKNFFFVDVFCSKIANEEIWPQQKHMISIFRNVHKVKRSFRKITFHYVVS